jgi:hypothetical protein
MIAAVAVILRENNHITISEIAIKMNIHVDCAHTVLPDELHYRRFCAQ